MAAKPETRVGIDLSDNGFRVVAIRLRSHCRSLDAPELKIECLHRVVESTPYIGTDIAAYLDVFASRLPRCATRGGVAASIAVPPCLQSLRCVPSSQLNEAERGIADELGGAVQCRSWQVGSQKSMICGVRSDVAEALVTILGDSGYRCESILPRSVAVARTLLASVKSANRSATILCWNRDRSLVTTLHDRTIRLCRELATDEVTSATMPHDDATARGASTEDRLSQIAYDLANETILTLQHARRLDYRMTPSPVVVCGEMSSFPGAIEQLNAALYSLIGMRVEPWKIPVDEIAANGLRDDCDRANTVAISLAIGGSRVAIDSLLTGGKAQ